MSIEETLELCDLEEGRRGDDLRGKIADPSGGSTPKAVTDGDANTQRLKRDSDFAIFTSKKNCEPNGVRILCLTRYANEAYNELRAKLEGNTIPDLGAVLSSIPRLTSNDRNRTVGKHIAEVDKGYNFVRATSSGPTPGEDKDAKECGEGLSKPMQNSYQYRRKLKKQIRVHLW